MLTWKRKLFNWCFITSLMTIGIGGKCFTIQIYGQSTSSLLCTTVISDDFESGLGNWDDPGSDCARINSASEASNGTFSLRLRDNSSTSRTTSINLDLSTADTVRVDFSFLAISMESGEDFFLEVSTNGGSSFSTVKTWVSGADFNNNTRYFEQVNIPGPLTTNTRFRFVCDASNNDDQVYFDEIVISSCVFTGTDCPTVNLQDTLICRPELLNIDGNPQGDSLNYTGHLWVDLGSGTSAGYSLSNTNDQIVTLNAAGASSGTVILSYTVTTAECLVTDTIIIQILSDPICDILSDFDTICAGTSIEVSAFTNYLLTPDSGYIPPVSSGVGFTQVHEIIGVQDPNSIKVIITLPTWDDHFDSTLLNGRMIIPKILETASYNANGMNCFTPWVPNINGLPRSIIEITSSQVRYFSSLTTTSTVMTEVFPTNWTTTPQPFQEGTNYLQFGIQNTFGPVSGSWFIEAIGTVGYTYLWSTGDTTAQITISPDSTTTYQLTVTSPSGCSSTCEKTIYVAYPTIDSISYQGCSGDGYGIEINGTVYNESNPRDTVVLMSSTGCDSTIIIDLTYDAPTVVEAGTLNYPLCSNNALTLADLNPSISGGINTGVWTSSGGGIFQNSQQFGGANPAITYTPSILEIDAGKLVLTLTSYDPPSTCEPAADAVMIVINDARCSDFPWSGNN